MASFGTYVVGQILTAAELNAEGAWTSTTTPTVGGLTKGNATTWYRKHYKFNKIGIMSVNLTFGSTSAVTGDVSIDLPSGWAATNNNGASGLVLTQAAGTVFPAYWRVNAAGGALLVRAINAASTYAQSTNFSASIPATWTTGDFIRFTAVIELD